MDSVITETPLSDIITAEANFSEYGDMKRSILGSIRSNWRMISKYLVILVVLYSLTANLFSKSDMDNYIPKKIIDTLSDTFREMITKFGVLFNKTTDIALDSTKGVVDLAATSAKGVTNLAPDSSKGLIDVTKGALEATVQRAKNVVDETTGALTGGINLLDKKLSESEEQEQEEPEPDETDQSTQTKKSGYCYIGEDRGFRSCVKVGEMDECMSGDIFPSEDVCINPSLRE